MTIPSNEDRAKSVAAAIQAFAKAQGLSEKDDGPEVIAGDMIANILHWAADRHPGGIRAAYDAACRGLNHFTSESYDSPDGDPLGASSHVRMVISVGKHIFIKQTGEPTQMLEAET